MRMRPRRPAPARGAGLLGLSRRQQELVKQQTILRVAKRAVQGTILGGMHEAGPKAGHYGSMRRAFKGIMPRSEAMHLRLAADRAQRRRQAAA